MFSPVAYLVDYVGAIDCELSQYGDSPVGLCALLSVPCTLLYCIIPLTFERVDATDYCLGLKILKLPTVIFSVVLHNEALITLATAARVCCSTLSVYACESDDNLLCAGNVVNST